MQKDYNHDTNDGDDVCHLCASFIFSEIFNMHTLFEPKISLPIHWYYDFSKDKKKKKTQLKRSYVICLWSHN